MFKKNGKTATLGVIASPKKGVKTTTQESKVDNGQKSQDQNHK